MPTRCRLLCEIISDFHKPTCCFCYCTFSASFCPFRRPSKQDSIFQFFTVSDISGITTQYPSGRMCPANEIAALLLECSAVPALAAVVMLSLSVPSAVNCVFCPGRLLFWAAVMFLLLPSFFFQPLWCELLFVCTASPRDNKRINCKMMLPV